MPEQDHRDQILITATRLARAREEGLDVVVLAVRSDDSSVRPPYAAAPRVPGAHDTSLADDWASPSDPCAGSRPLPDPAALQARLRSLGVGRGTMVVVYDHDGNLQAGRAWWVLRWLGVDTRLLDGGFAAWQRAGLPVVHAPPATPEAGDVAVRPGGLGILDAEAAAGLARTGVLLDSRMHANYLGAPTLPGERGRGHIPGALSLPAADNLDAAGCFADSARLRARYASLGADGSRSIGVYCGAGVSAAHNVAALAILGLSASMYPGSWSAWSADLGLPVAIGPEPG